MTDRELLEMAAKAAVVEFDAEQSKPHQKSGAFWGLWLVIHGEPSESQRRYWNPLKDDGDALRLAVKLVLLVDVLPNSTTVCAMRGGIVNEEHGSDPFAATRRAIVRYAAELGKETK